MGVSASLRSLVWSNFKNTKDGLLQGYLGTVIQEWALKTVPFHVQIFLDVSVQAELRGNCRVFSHASQAFMLSM